MCWTVPLMRLDCPVLPGKLLDKARKLLITGLFEEDLPCLGWEDTTYHEHYRQNFIGFKI